MNKKIILFVIIMSLFKIHAVSDGNYLIKGGYGLVLQPEHNLAIYYGDVGFSKARYYENTLFGTTFGLDINFPTHYSIGRNSSEFANTFKNFISLDAYATASFRKQWFSFSLGPAVGIDFLQTQQNTFVMETTFGVMGICAFDIPLSNTIGLNIGVDTTVDFFIINYIDAKGTGFKIPRITVNPYLGLAIYFSDARNFGKQML